MISQQLIHSEQPLVPERVVLFGQNGDGKGAGETGLFQSIIQVLTTWQNIGGDAPSRPKATPEEKQPAEEIIKVT
jgi:hypothetical protein